MVCLERRRLHLPSPGHAGLEAFWCCGAGGREARRVKVPNPGDLGWSAQRVAQWYVLRAFSRMEQRHLKEAEEDLEEAKRLAKRALDR